jgi:adenylate cyclase class 2
MYEVEVKVRADHSRVRERLADLGASHLDTVRQVDTYFDAPDRDFARTDEALRIRREQPADGDAAARVTYKGPLVDEASKTREEAEAGVVDADAMTTVLEGLGFEPAATVRKHRERFEYGEFLVTLDDVDGLGEFVEVETETETDVAAARNGAFDVIEGVGLDPDDGIRTSYLGLLLAESESDVRE